MSAWVAIWFIMANGMGYIPYQEVRPPQMTCGLEGPIVGVQIDRLKNPTTALWPDPKVAGKHCTVSIATRVMGLAVGKYHLATTIMMEGPEQYIGHDPHTSVEFERTELTGGLSSPGSIRIKGQ